MNIAQDFNDRLVADDVADFDDYKEYVINIDTQYRPYLTTPEIKSRLERIQNDHFQHKVEGMDKPPELKQLLKQYLEKENILPNQREDIEDH